MSWKLEIENPSDLIYLEYANAGMQKCKLKCSQDSDLKVFRYKIDGDIIFRGVDFTTLIGFRTNNDNVNARISNEYITLNGKLNLLRKWNETQKICELKFDVTDEYNLLVKGKEIEYNILSDLITYNLYCNYPTTPITYSRFRDFNDMLLKLFSNTDSTITTISDLTGFLSDIYIASISDIILNDDYTEKTNPATICNTTLVKVSQFLRDIFHIYWYKSGTTIYFYYDNYTLSIGTNNPNISAWEPYNDYNISNEKRYGRIKRDLLAYWLNHVGYDIIYYNSNNNEVEKISNKDFSTDLQGTFYRKSLFPSDTTTQVILVKSDINNIIYATFYYFDNPAALIVGYPFDTATYIDNIITLIKTTNLNYQSWASLWVNPFDQPNDITILEFDYNITGDSGLNIGIYNYSSPIENYNFTGNSGHAKLSVRYQTAAEGFYIGFGSGVSYITKTITITNLKVYVISPYVTLDDQYFINNKLSTHYIDSLPNIRKYYYRDATINQVNTSGLLLEKDKELDIEFPLKDITELNPYKPIDIGIASDADIVEFSQELNNYNDKVTMKVKY